MAVVAWQFGKDKYSVNFFGASGNGTLMVKEVSTTRVLNRNREFSIYPWKNIESML